MAESSEYTVIGIAKGREKRWVVRGAPSISRCAMWGNNHKLDFVTRYFPKYKGWRLIDLRRSFTAETRGGRPFVKAARTIARTFPNPEAALMAATHVLMDQDRFDF